VLLDSCGRRARRCARSTGGERRPDASFGERAISCCATAPRDARGADALAIVTEWKEFRSPDFDFLKKQLKSPVIFDGRNLYDPAMMKKLGFKYYAIGRGEGVTA
jgi:UDPglucose 6-dehydrogenase